jgi:hypothetical protein
MSRYSIEDAREAIEERGWSLTGPGERATVREFSHRVGCVLSEYGTVQQFLADAPCRIAREPDAALAAELRDFVDTCRRVLP